MNAEVLRDLEELAAACDVLDEEARRGEMPYANDELQIRFTASRRRVLRELEVAGVFDVSLSSADRALMQNFPVISSFHEAAVALHHYHGSLARSRRGNEPAADSVLEAHVSLDWFRRPAGYRPDKASADEWLSECEYHFTHYLPTFPAGRRFVNLYGAAHQLWFRTEARQTPSLYRAELAT